MLLYIRVTNGFDGSTPLPASPGFKLTPIEDAVDLAYLLTDPAGQPFADLGLIQWQHISPPLGGLFGQMVLASHNGGAAASSFSVDVGYQGSSFIRTSKTLTCDPTGGEPTVSGLLITNPLLSLRLRSDVAGAQVVVLDLQSIKDLEGLMVASNSLGLATPPLSVVARIVFSGTIRSANWNAQSNEAYAYDPGAAITCTMPAAPARGDTVEVHNASASAVPLTVDGNGNQIVTPAGAIAANSSVTGAYASSAWIFTGDHWAMRFNS